MFARGAPGLAILSSSVGIGAVAGGFWLAQPGGQARLTRVVLISSLLIALSTLGFALSTWFPAAIACVAVDGFAMVAAGVGTQTLLQTAVDERMRGRVLSLFGLIFRGGPALGALVDRRGLRAGRAAGAARGRCAARHRRLRLDLAPAPDDRPRPANRAAPRRGRLTEGEDQAGSATGECSSSGTGDTWRPAA